MISIAMATYNGEKYLREQLNSILAQTCSDFELIACDDGSTDSTVQILNEYAEKDKRIKVFVNERNLGFAKNFEKLVSLCSGDYIAFCDQDDIWENKHLEIFLNEIGEAKVVCGNELLFDNETKEKRLKIPYNQNIFPADSKNLLWTFSYTNNFFAGNAMLVERKFLVEKNILPIPNGISHDSWIALCACCFSKMKFTEKVVTNRRLHHTNTTGLTINDKKFYHRVLNRLFGRKKRKDIYKNIVFTFESLAKKTEIPDSAKDVLKEAIKIAEGKEGCFGSVKRFKGLVCLWKNYRKIFFWERKKSILKIFIYLF